MIQSLTGSSLTLPELAGAEAWLADKLKLEQAVAEFCRTQPEQLRLESLQVEQVAGELVTFLVRGHGADHESTHLFEVEVRAAFNPAAGLVARLS